MKSTKKLCLLVCLVLLSLSLILTSCEDSDLPTPADSDLPEILESITKTEWNAMISEVNFENYTLDMTGRMTTYQGGVEVSVSDVNETIKVTSDKILIHVNAADTNSSATAEEDALFEGDLAQSQKNQFSWLFLTMLEQFDRFSFDAETTTYKLKNQVHIEDVMEGVLMSGDHYETFDVPTKIDMRNAEVTISKDGKLLKFVCDYSQEMEMGSGIIVTVSGETTWAFSNYGTTVITETK